MDKNSELGQKQKEDVNQLSQNSRKKGEAIYYRFALRIMGDFGVAIAVPAVIAAFGGIWLDRKFGTTPWLMVIGLVAAFTATFLVIKKKAQVYAKQFEELNK